MKYGNINGWKPDRCACLTYCLGKKLYLTSDSLVCESVSHAADRSYSHVVVTTKAVPELLRTPAILSPLLTPPYSDRHPQPTYVLLQNGLNVESDLYDAIKHLDKGEPRIISTAVWIATNLLDDNVVEHSDFVCLL